MRVTRILTLALLVFVLTLTTITDAKRSGGSSRSSSYSGSRSSGRSTSRSSSTYRGRSNRNYYTGVIIIANPNGYYYEGYGEQCLYGCAIDGACGTREECEECLANGDCMGVEHGPWFWWIIALSTVICSICGLVIFYNCVVLRDNNRYQSL